MTVKSVLGFLFILFVGSFFIDSKITSPAWLNPHKQIFKVDNEKMYVKNNFVKPDLNQLKEEKYFYLSIRKAPESAYVGLLTIRPAKEGGIKVGGAIYKGAEGKKLSLLNVTVVEKPNMYELQIATKPATDLFANPKIYTEKIEFPVKLQINKHPKKDKSVVMGSLVPENEDYSVVFYELKGKPQEPLFGKWNGYNQEGDWEVKINEHMPYQVNGTAKLVSDEKVKCHYPIYGFVSGYEKVTLFTGESAENKTNCPVRVWLAKKNTYNGYELEDYYPTGNSGNMGLTKALD